MKNHIKKSILVVVFIYCSLIFSSPSNATTLSPTDLRIYAANQIYFLNECEETDDSSNISGTAVANGSTSDEKIWSALKSLGFSDEIAAGILGNIHNEGGASPVRQEGCFGSCSDDGFDLEHDPGDPANHIGAKGIGLIQWSYGRRVDLIKHLRDIGAGNLADKYILNNIEKYGGLSGDEFIKVADNDEEASALFAAEIDFLKFEMETNGAYKPVLDTKTVEEAALEFSVRVEACTKCTDRNSDENQERIAAAKQMYQKFTGKTSFGGTSSSGSSHTSGSTDCGCTVTKTSSSSTASNITFDKDGWIEGGIDGFKKDSAIGTSYINDSAANKSFSTEMPNGEGKGPNKITLHSTEGSNGGGGSPLSFFGGFPPHFTIDLKEKHIFQHFPIYKTSAAVKTHDDTAGVQIEIIGYSDTNLAKQRSQSKWILSSYSENEVSYLADLLKGISKATGIPLTSSVDWSGGSNTTHRLSVANFKKYQGILGHRHVPDNDHWDADGIWETLKKTLGSSANDTSDNTTNKTEDENNNSSAGTNIKNNGENVTIIGDSITNGSKSALKSKLKNADIIAQDSKNMFGNSSSNKSGETIVADLIKNNNLRQLVVIALGTNDGTISENDVKSKIIEPIKKDGQHTIIFVTTYGHGRSDGQDFSANNSVFNSLKNSNSNILIADWASAAGKDPDKFISKADGLGVHPTNPDGTELFAKTVYDALTGASVQETGFGNECPADNNSASSGDVAALQATVKEFAYPTYLGRDCAQCVTKKPAYEKAIQGAKYRGDGCYGGGVDCGAFVYNAIVESGWDPNYGGGSGQTVAVQNWMRGAGASTWENVTSQIKSNADAKPGDVILSADHVLLFVGKIDGFSSVMASASQCHRAPMADSASDISNYINQGYEIWRKK